MNKPVYAAWFISNLAIAVKPYCQQASTLAFMLDRPKIRRLMRSTRFFFAYAKI